MYFKACFFFLGGIILKILEDKILKDGIVLEGNILKVGSFLNQQLDVNLINEMGKEIARLFKDKNITKILTIESSGIAIAFAAGLQINCPVVFAKKGKSANLSGELFVSTVYSYTHKTSNDIFVSKDYLSNSDNVLIVDDFLASGEALEGLIKIVKQSGANIVGAACAIEKGFQDGGDKLRSEGYKIESLAIIDEMDTSRIKFRCK